MKLFFILLLIILLFNYINNCKLINNNNNILIIENNDNIKFLLNYENDNKNNELKHYSIIGAQYKYDINEAVFNIFGLMRLICFINNNNKIKNGNILFLGLGIGSLPRFIINNKNICNFNNYEIVEYDNLIIDYSIKYFNFPKNDTINNNILIHKPIDAKKFIFNNNKFNYYNIILQDLYIGKNPLHVLEINYFKKIKKLLNINNGLYILNFVSYYNIDNKKMNIFTLSIIKTLKNIFNKNDYNIKCLRDISLNENKLLPSNILCFIFNKKNFINKSLFNNKKLLNYLNNNNYDINDINSFGWLIYNYKNLEINLKDDYNNSIILYNNTINKNNNIKSIINNINNDMYDIVKNIIPYNCVNKIVNNNNRIEL